jgi:hypothetical protein
MWFVRIEEIFHRISYAWSHVLEPRMVEPVSGSIFDKRNVIDIILVRNAIVQTEENAQAGFGKDRVRRLEKNVIAGDVPTRIGQPIGGEELLDRKMGKLHHFRFSIIDNCNQTGACRQYGLVVICPSPIWVQLWNSSVSRRIKVNREDFCELFNSQRPKRNSETLQKTAGMFSICLVNLP